MTRASPSHEEWQVWIDTGGTFTDCMVEGPDGSIRRVKVLSSGALRGTIAKWLDARRLRTAERWPLPDGFFRGARLRLLEGDAAATVLEFDARQGQLTLSSELPDTEAGAVFEVGSEEEAPLLAARMAIGTPLGEPLPPISMRLASTRGTNALLQRRGADTVLFVTRGFRDLLEIGNQQRRELFALAVQKPAPLYRGVVEVEERLAADGRTLRPLDLSAIAGEARDFLHRGIDCAAVSLLHSYRDPAHERRLGEFLEQLGFRHVSLSSELAPRIKVLPRAETAVVNAFLAPVIEDHLRGVQRALGSSPLHVMTSTGGIVRQENFQPKDSLLSGPAGGVVGAAAAGRRSGLERCLAFDMGGTSTDVSRYDGDFDYSPDTRVAEVRLMAPSLAIETVAAGGGSICRFDGRQVRVGPASAGALPGPACYGAGGPLTLTDVNLLLGRLDAERFEIPIAGAAAERSALRLLEEIRQGTGESLELEEMLVGCLSIANERMAEAVRRISIRRGYDPSDYALVAFGGAGGQHACALAEVLEMDTVLAPADAALLSAAGLGRARLERFAERQVLQPLAACGQALEEWIDGLAAEAVARVEAEGVSAAEITVRRRTVFLRLQGQESTLPVEIRHGRSLREDFLRAYREHYGYRPERRSIEVESIRAVAASRGRREEEWPEVACGGRPAEPTGRRNTYLGGTWGDVPLFERQSLEPGRLLEGPSLVFDRYSVTVVERGWRGGIDGAGGLLLRRDPQGPDGAAPACGGES